MKEKQNCCGNFNCKSSQNEYDSLRKWEENVLAVRNQVLNLKSAFNTLEHPLFETIEKALDDYTLLVNTVYGFTEFEEELAKDLGPTELHYYKETTLSNFSNMKATVVENVDGQESRIVLDNVDALIKYIEGDNYEESQNNNSDVECCGGRCCS